MVLDGVAARSRGTDPVTSVDAGRSARLCASQAAVMACMTHGRNRTQGELEYLLPEWSPSRIRSAVTELEAQGQLVRTDRTRLTKYGRAAQVWEAAA